MQECTGGKGQDLGYDGQVAPEGLYIIGGHIHWGPHSQGRKRGRVLRSRTKPIPTTVFSTAVFSVPVFLSKSQRPCIPTGQRGNIRVRGWGQDLLETRECLVNMEGSHQHGHSGVTDGIALQTAIKDKTVLMWLSQDLEPYPMGSTGSWGPGDCSSHPSFLASHSTF